MLLAEGQEKTHARFKRLLVGILRAFGLVREERVDLFRVRFFEG
jgi:hypothetical protein